jgi:hypothetical protein
MNHLKDMTGLTFGRWTVVTRGQRSGDKARWVCQCACGATREVLGTELRSGGSASCGCAVAQQTGDRLRRDIRGRRFGMLVAMEPEPGKVPRWRFRCDCGRIAALATYAVTRRGVSSCGCERRHGTGIGLDTLRSRYLGTYTPEPNTGCWLWLGPLDSDGYGALGSCRFGEKRAHRFFWQEFWGEVPDGLCVCHSCDTPACVNPRHMFLGTNEDNVLDMEAKGRRAKGERVTRSVLTTGDVIAIRARVAAGESAASLAREFLVSKTCIRAVLTRKTWAHVEGAAA